MRKPVIVGNWKMNKTIAETKEFVAAIDPLVHDRATFGIATPYLDLPAAVEGCKNLIVAAENCHFEDKGAFTGEVSVPMLEEQRVTNRTGVYKVYNFPVDEKGHIRLVFKKK